MGQERILEKNWSPNIKHGTKDRYSDGLRGCNLGIDTMPNA